MGKEKVIAEYYNYSERTIFSFKASDDKKLNDRYNALIGYKPFQDHLKKVQSGKKKV